MDIIKYSLDLVTINQYEKGTIRGKWKRDNNKVFFGSGNQANIN
jgi:hypothetical protein